MSRADRQTVGLEAQRGAAGAVRHEVAAPYVEVERLAESELRFVVR